jgi:hypothetical protein
MSVDSRNRSVVVSSRLVIVKMTWKSSQCSARFGQSRTKGKTERRKEGSLAIVLSRQPTTGVLLPQYSPSSCCPVIIPSSESSRMVVVFLDGCNDCSSTKARHCPSRDSCSLLSLACSHVGPSILSIASYIQQQYCTRNSIGTDCSPGERTTAKTKSSLTNIIKSDVSGYLY